MSEFDECIRLLLVATEPMSIQSIVAHVPQDRKNVVGRLVLQSALVASTTSGKIQHAWAEHARKLTAAAKDEIRVLPWATAASTPAPIAFVTYVMDNVDKLGLHTRWYGVVREQTALNIYDCEGLVACVKHAAEVGVNRNDIMAEYELAYVDFHNLVKGKKFFATNDRAWHV